MANEFKAPGDCKDTGCIAPKKPQPVVIDFLYIDAGSKSNWQDSLLALNESIGELTNILNASGLYIEINQTLISTQEQAIAHRLVCSPTIRINGIDIAQTTHSTIDDFGFRVWNYKGAIYSAAPKPLILSAIIKAIYGAAIPAIEHPYTLPPALAQQFSTQSK
jgi:hypothetical protein